MLELYIFGPAFGLPSIDVNCLAATALLNLYFSNFGDDRRWSLISCNDPTVSPFNELPALRDGSLWVTGFRNIAAYLSTQRSQYNLNEKIQPSLDETQSADTEAYLSFLESRGLPLLDLSIYVSSDNYTNLTRAALTDLIPWPQSWTVPQRLRNEAKNRSEHLGLSGLDVDAVREKELKQENEGISAVIPKSLRIPKKSVTSLLGSTAEQTRFRLEAVTADFFEPLEALMGDQKYFLGDKMTVLDCFALAILGQMSVDGMPQPWLKHALQKYPRLWKWTQQNITQVYNLPLPWAKTAERSWVDLAANILDTIAESLPLTILNSPVRTQTIGMQSLHVESSVTARFKTKQDFHERCRKQRDLVRGTMAATLSSAGAIGTMLYMGVITLDLLKRNPQPIKQGFGEAGALLGLR